MIKKKINKIALFYLIVIIALVMITSCNLKTSITGFAVLDENTTNETITTETTTDTTTNETIAEETKEKPEKEAKPEEKPEKPEPNVPPAWKSDINEFELKGKTSIDL